MDGMAPKRFYDSGCMHAGGGKSELSSLLMPYSYFQTLNVIPSQKHGLRTDLVRGVAGPPAGAGRPVPKSLRLALVEVGLVAVLPLWKQHPNWLTRGAHADLLNLCPPTHSILRIAETSEGLAHDHTSFPPFWDKPRPLCFLLALMSLGNSRCLCPKRSRGLRWRHLSGAVRSFISVEYKKQSF